MLKNFAEKTFKDLLTLTKPVGKLVVIEFCKRKEQIKIKIKRQKEIQSLKDKILVDLHLQLENLYLQVVNHEVELKILLDENIKERFINILNNNFEKRKNGWGQSSFKDNLAARNFTNAFISDIQYNLSFMNKKVNAKKVKDEIEKVIDGYFGEWSESKV